MEDNMIHRNTSTVANGGSRGRRANAGIPFLTADKLTPEMTPVKILGARVQPDNFKPDQNVVVVKLALKGNTYLWTLRNQNPNLDILCDTFGEDELKWIGEEIQMYVEVDDFDNKSWIRVSASKPAAKKR
jgi:hypothetical protein